MNRKLCASLLAAALLGGCAGAGGSRPGGGGDADKADPPPVNLSGYNATFRQGYSDGCASAGATVRRRNESRYKTETDYMMGWNDGYSVCGKRR